MGKLKITLTIANASGLYALAQPVLQTVTDSFCVLSDSNGAVSQVGDIENFQSTALVNQDLSWKEQHGAEGILLQSIQLFMNQIRIMMSIFLIVINYLLLQEAQ